MPRRRPVLLAVDDDPETLRALARDLRRRYQRRFRVLRAADAERALETLRELAGHDHPVALVLAGLDMTGMSGLDLLTRVRELLPETRTVLLTSYAETDSAIRAINAGTADDYVVTPWDPPEDRLYPVLDDLLDEWAAEHLAPEAGVRVVGHRWDRDSHRVRHYLSRNQVPFIWYDLEVHPQAHRLLEPVGGEGCALPLVILPGGEHLCNPATEDLAASPPG